jgi:hypothetical protein
MKKQTNKINRQEMEKITTEISKVYDKLEDLGIVGRMNWTCCQTCSRSEINEFKEGHIGFVFYHGQDADGLKEYGNTYLAFGSFNDVEAEHIKIGKAIVKAFKKNGKFKVEWDENTDTRIMIEWLGVKK